MFRHLPRQLWRFISTHCPNFSHIVPVFSHIVHLEIKPAPFPTAIFIHTDRDDENNLTEITQCEIARMDRAKVGTMHVLGVCVLCVVTEPGDRWGLRGELLSTLPAFRSSMLQGDIFCQSQVPHVFIMSFHHHFILHTSTLYLSNFFAIIRFILQWNFQQ